MNRLLHVIVFLSLISACGRPSEVSSMQNPPEGSVLVSSSISNMKVNSIVQDREGRIWMGTFRGLNCYDSKDYHQFFCYDDNEGLYDNQINDLIVDSEGTLWVATVNGINRYKGNGRFDRVESTSPIRDFLYGFQTVADEIFFFDGQYLCRYNSEKNLVEAVVPDAGFNPYRRFFPAPDSRIWCVQMNHLYRLSRDFQSADMDVELPIWPSFVKETSNGDIWMSDGNRILLYNMIARHEIPLSRAITTCEALCKSVLRAVCPIGTRYILFCTDKGYYLYDNVNDKVVDTKSGTLPFELPGFTNVTDIFRDNDHNLWFASEDKGYFVSQRYPDMFSRTPLLSEAFKGNSIVSIAYNESADAIIVATKHDGLFLYDRQKNTKHAVPGQDARLALTASDGSLWTINQDGGKLTNWTVSPDRLIRNRSYDIWYPISITEDSRGTIWMGCAYGILQYLDKGSNEVKTLQCFDSSSFSFTPGLCPLDDGNLLVAAFNRPAAIVTPSGEVKTMSSDPDQIKSYITRSSFVPTATIQDRDGDIWIGTIANGLLFYSASIGEISRVGGEPCADITGIVEDKEGFIWVSTMNGIGRLDKKTMTFSNYFIEDGIGGNQFIDRSSCMLPDGTILFGGNHGITCFNPHNRAEPRKVPVVLDDIKIHNRLVLDLPGMEDGDMRLDYTQNVVSIGFTALNYNQGEHPRYQYRMEGYDPSWIDAGMAREAIYTNLPAGRFNFQVKVDNSVGNIYSDVISFPIVITPAPWCSWWAYCLYVLALIGAVLAIVIPSRRARKDRMAAERAERERKFYTNIAHEFRSPLTMISGPLNSLDSSGKLTGNEKKLLDVARKSSNWMLQLVGQFLDLGKLADDTLKLSVKKMDVPTALFNIAEVFSVNAETKGIRFVTEGLVEPFEMPVDLDKLIKITSNLLSNAFKYTPSGGTVKLRFDTQPDGFAEISVIDNGPGIPDELKEKVFDRYYQLDGGGKYNAGTGIGLYYSRKLAEIHHGRLWVENPVSGQGSCFKVLLPYNENAYAPEEYTEDTPQMLLNVDTRTRLSELQSEKSGNKRRILAVDDDMDVAHYLQILLSEEYDVTCCFSADSALAHMAEELPDLVISDVMMPDKDGIQFCKEIKQNLQMSHVPVILVTAKATVDNQVEGIEAGADAYVTKPFEPKFLMAIIKSQLEKKHKFQQSLNESTSVDEVKIEENLAPQDKAFLTRFYAIMEESMGDSNMDINRIADMMGISRTKFYYKVKGLTGESPGVFFKNYKFNRSVALIREGEHNLSEIAYMCGFTSLSQFSTSFKKQFGVPPSEYK